MKFSAVTKCISRLILAIVVAWVFAVGVALPASAMGAQAARGATALTKADQQYPVSDARRPHRQRQNQEQCQGQGQGQSQGQSQ
ncbi:MAG: hypothetical protein J2P36_28440, partial [Ktedonobacteraceae bacterium]|nr:hypothetical protein [Ktedonobacteraceae bacterium]